MKYLLIKPNNRGSQTSLDNAVLCILVLLTPGLQLTLVATKKNKTFHDYMAYSFLSKAVFVFPTFLAFPSILKSTKTL